MGTWRLWVALISIGLVALGPALLVRDGSSLAAAPGGVRWIDVHVHLIGGGAGPQGFAEAARAALAAMDEAGIRTMVAMPPPQVSGQPGVFDYDGFLPAIKPHPARFAFLGGGGSLNPMLQAAAQETSIGDDLRRRFEAKAAEILQQGAAGFGEMTAHHLSLQPGHPYEVVAPDHPLLRLLADIAARHDVVIDLHLDLVVEDTKTPERLSSPPNPPVLRANLAALERLLDYNRTAKVVWAHAGSDQLGYWTAELSRELLRKHGNLYMSLRMGPGLMPQNFPLTPAGVVKPEWLRLLQEFPDRFVLGGDQFFLAPALQGRGPAGLFSQRAPAIRERTRAFLNALPPELAQKIGYENAIRLYRLKE